MKKYFFLVLIVTLTLFISRSSTLYAQEKLSLSVTPPLFQLSIGPGEFWASQVKVINTNPYDITVYAKVVNFEGQGEGGEGTFRPVTTSDEKAYTLAGWIDVASKPVVIKRDQSADIPFSVQIPKNAPPGGHYAAILVGTEPPDGGTGSRVKISSLVTSLIFVRIAGDVLESGDIREFYTEANHYEKPEANFVLRFENKGNVHLQPQGNVQIVNMWGGEAGNIPVNQKSNFGSVLPQSIRKYAFKWTGEDSLLNFGRLKAIATLTYGSDSKKNVESITYFWVLPIVPFFVFLTILVLVIILITYLIRRYVRKTLKMATENILHAEHEPTDGVIDLRRKR